MKDWKEWLDQQVAKSTMRVEKKPLTGVAGWGMQEGGERFGRPDGSFFGLVGVKVSTMDGEREVPGWEQPMLQDAGGGVVLLARQREGTVEILVRAKPEAGSASPGRILLAAALQASWSNLQAAHGGKKPPRAEYADKVPEWVPVRKDGARYFEKTDQHGVCWVQGDGPDLDQAERWFSLQELAEASREGLLNEHLVTGVGLLLLSQVASPA